MIDLVIAHYNEDISWLQKVDEERFKIHVYTKETPMVTTMSNTWNVVILPNVGRESQSYLHHIITCYRSANRMGYTVFTQANPFPHCVDFLEQLNEIPKSNKFRNYCADLNYGYMSFTDNIICEDAFYADAQVQEYWLKIFNESCTDKIGQPFCFHPCAIYCVANRLTYQRPISFWEQLEIISRENEKNGHLIERTWESIFIGYPNKTPLMKGHFYGV